MNGQESNPFKKTDKIIVLYIHSYIFWIEDKETKGSELTVVNFPRIITAVKRNGRKQLKIAVSHYSANICICSSVIN
jgi:hypothetical protein